MSTVTAAVNLSAGSPRVAARAPLVCRCRRSARPMPSAPPAKCGKLSTSIIPCYFLTFIFHPRSSFFIQMCRTTRHTLRCFLDRAMRTGCTLSYLIKSTIWSTGTISSSSTRRHDSTGLLIRSTNSLRRRQAKRHGRQDWAAAAPGCRLQTMPPHPHHLSARQSLQRNASSGR